MRGSPVLAALLILLALSACTSTATTEEEILAGTADTASAIGTGAEFVFWEIPKFILWTLPKAILYDAPRAVVLSIRGNRAQVEALMQALLDNELSVEEEAAASAELRELTRLPIRATERWKEWWVQASVTPERQWREDFVTGAIRDLLSADYFTRVTAIVDLRHMYGTDLDYDPKALPAGRAEGAARWRAHYREHGMPRKRP